MARLADPSIGGAWLRSVWSAGGVETWYSAGDFRAATREEEERARLLAQPVRNTLGLHRYRPDPSR
ncbi:hypothetical protein ACN20G_15295 [Streptomyces sp. BI20]|uniref:hypothetical protein n=1 Tax=Streptomyces sp. BI20 TaxID=3403460 RepID=UPI003C72B3AA